LTASANAIIQGRERGLCLQGYDRYRQRTGAGIYRYLWPKPEVDGRNYPKVSIVRSFEPFNWFIGTGIYEDDMQAQVKEDVLGRLKKSISARTVRLPASVPKA